MEVERVLRMTGGTGETGYAKNSTLQEKAILAAKPIVEDSIVDLYCTNFPESLSIADLGCSSGPNTLTVISEIIDCIDQKCHQLSRSPPEFHVYLNDLPGNDFNTLFKSLPGFYNTLKQKKGPSFGPCFIFAMPGSFYGRLFPSRSLHFAHSSYCLHWLSQVPQGLFNEMGAPILNKGNIYMAKTSPPLVFKAYLDQFKRDFTLFLRMRAEEISYGGRMVLTLLGRTSPNPFSGECTDLLKLLSEALIDMASQGIIEEAKVDSFNLPCYTPSDEELKAIIQDEGSFNLDCLNVIKMNWDPNDNDDSEGFVFDEVKSGRNSTEIVRDVTESLLASHFGETIMEDLYERYMEKVTHHLAKEKTKYVNLTVSLSRNG